MKNMGTEVLRKISHMTLACLVYLYSPIVAIPV